MGGVVTVNLEGPYVTRKTVSPDKSVLFSSYYRQRFFYFQPENPPRRRQNEVSRLRPTTPHQRPSIGSLFS